MQRFYRVSPRAGAHPCGHSASADRIGHISAQELSVNPPLLVRTILELRIHLDVSAPTGATLGPWAVISGKADSAVVVGAAAGASALVVAVGGRAATVAGCALSTCETVICADSAEKSS